MNRDGEEVGTHAWVWQGWLISSRCSFAASSGQLTSLYWYTAGQQITEQVLALDIFKQSMRIGIYVHAAKLREVDTTAIISAVLDSGLWLDYVFITSEHNSAFESQSWRQSWSGWFASNIAGKQCFVPLVVDDDSNMRLLHLGVQNLYKLSQYIIRDCIYGSSHIFLLISKRQPLPLVWRLSKLYRLALLIDSNWHDPILSIV